MKTSARVYAIPSILHSELLLFLKKPSAIHKYHLLGCASNGNCGTKSTRWYAWIVVQELVCCRHVSFYSRIATQELLWSFCSLTFVHVVVVPELYEVIHRPLSECHLECSFLGTGTNAHSSCKESSVVFCTRANGATFHTVWITLIEGQSCSVWNVTRWTRHNAFLIMQVCVAPAFGAIIRASHELHWEVPSPRQMLLGFEHSLASHHPRIHLYR